MLASKSSIDRPSTPAAPWLAFTRLKASQTSRLGIRNGFAPVHRFILSPVGPWPRLNNAAPWLQGPSTLLRAAPSLPCVSVLSPSRLAPLVACPFTPPIEGERRDAVQVLTLSLI